MIYSVGLVAFALSKLHCAPLLSLTLSFSSLKTHIETATSAPGLEMNHRSLKLLVGACMSVVFEPYTSKRRVALFQYAYV